MIIDLENLKRQLVNSKALLDVRAPVEFSEGHIPGAVNIPILEDEERAAVGRTYKNEGQAAAIALGHNLVQGEKREKRIEKWIQFFKENPQGLLYCFRGGLRSQTAQKWLAESGLQVLRLQGGYKAARQMLLHNLDEASVRHKYLIVSGPTGSGKTHLLREAKKFAPGIDLEFLARHRGSAFGFEPVPQPSPAQFENELSVEFLKLAEVSKAILLEDESRLIGHRVIPDKMFNKMRESPIVWIDEPLEKRIENIFVDYVMNTAIAQGLQAEALALFQKYEKSLQGISKKLGGLRTQEILADMKASQSEYLEKREFGLNRVWIEKLLIYYYDPLYLGSLDRRRPVIQIKAPAEEVLRYLQSSFS